MHSDTRIPHDDDPAPLAGLQQGEVLDRWLDEDTVEVSPLRKGIEIVAIVLTITLLLAVAVFAEPMWTAHNAARLDAEFGQ